MSDELRTLAQGLIEKLEAHQFKVDTFVSTTEVFVSNAAKTNSYMSISGSGKQENFEALQASLSDKEKEVEISINFGPQPGDACEDLPVKVTATKEDKVLTFSVDDNKVYLLDFWATWCGPCQGPMKHNQEMLERNPHWEGKAEIVAISLDDDTEAVIKRIEERGWTKVTSYWAGPQGFGEVAPRKFDVNGIPSCALVHNGKVLWTGHPSERNLENDINGLIEGKPLSSEEKPAEGEKPPTISSESHNEMISKAREKHSEFIQAHPTLKAPEVVSVHNLSIKKNQEPESKYDFYILGGFLQKYKEIGESYQNTMKEIFPGANDRIRFEETSTISRGNSCNLCNLEFGPTDTQYLCVFCEPSHYNCQACQTKEREGQGSAKLAHPHSLYIITPEADNLDEIRFGKNRMNQDRFYETDPESNVHRGVGCDNRNDPNSGCPGPVPGIRYKCAHCPDYDFCQTCFGKWSEPSESMVSVAKGMGHLKSHVFISIPFPY